MTNNIYSFTPNTQYDYIDGSTGNVLLTAQQKIDWSNIMTDYSFPVTVNSDLGTDHIFVYSYPGQGYLTFAQDENTILDIAISSSTTSVNVFNDDDWYIKFHQIF